MGRSGKGFKQVLHLGFAGAGTTRDDQDVCGGGFFKLIKAVFEAVGLTLK